MTLAEEDLDPGADTLVVSYGVSARAAKEACLDARAAGRRVAFLGLKTLFPVPAALLSRAAAGRRRVVFVEENLKGLYASVAAPHVLPATVVRVTEVGRQIAPSRVRAALEAA
jgi:Pyruvate:ferredoxin oxidoreductase and related 2-oxoacid:ferredoxin oxidoreductases, alpha subunit